MSLLLPLGHRFFRLPPSLQTNPHVNELEIWPRPRSDGIIIEINADSAEEGYEFSPEDTPTSRKPRVDQAVATLLTAFPERQSVGE